MYRTGVDRFEGEIIDLRDLIDEMNQLAPDRCADCGGSEDDHLSPGDEDYDPEIDDHPYRSELDEEDREFVKAYRELEGQLWTDIESMAHNYGAILVADDYFVQYAEDYADSIGAIDRNADWPTMYIDWERAAADLRQDFTEITVRGRVFWLRG